VRIVLQKLLHSSVTQFECSCTYLAHGKGVQQNVVLTFLFNVYKRFLKFCHVFLHFQRFFNFCLKVIYTYEYNYIIVHPKVSFAGLVCRTQQHYHRQWLPNIGWLNSGRWPKQGIDGYGGKNFEKKKVIREK